MNNRDEKTNDNTISETSHEKHGTDSVNPIDLDPEDMP